MNIADTTDIFIRQGATWIMPLGVEVDGAQASWLGYTARMQARLTLDTALPFISLTTENGGITCDSQYVTLFMTDTATALLGAIFGTDNKAVYDVEIIAPDGTVTRPWHGTLELLRSVTH